jgi:hypothetical protein
MGFIITDLANEDSKLFVNFWNWHPAVELIRSFSILDDERVEMMHIQTVGVKVTKEEAFEIGKQIEVVLNPLPSNARIKLDLSVTTEPDDFQMHYGEDADLNYSATIDWLRNFSEFCKNCDGFEVL